MNNYQEKNNELWLEKYERAKQYYVENGNLFTGHFIEQV